MLSRASRETGCADEIYFPVQECQRHYKHYPIFADDLSDIQLFFCSDWFGCSKRQYCALEEYSRTCMGSEWQRDAGNMEENMSVPLVEAGQGEETITREPWGKWDVMQPIQQQA